MTLSVLHAPCHGPSLNRRAIGHALSLGADTIGFTEAYRRIWWLRTRRRFLCAVGRSPSDPRRGAHDNPILTRRDITRLDWWAVKACDASTPVKIAPERWITGVILDHPFGTVEHIHLHPNAAVRGHDPEHVDRAAKYAEQLAELERRVTKAHDAGHLVVVTGDLNFPDENDAPSWAPGPTFARLGLQTWIERIDWIAFDRRLRRDSSHIIQPDQNGQDHPWMLAHFVLEHA